jgi:hypothetical protein
MGAKDAEEERIKEEQRLEATTGGRKSGGCKY